MPDGSSRKVEISLKETVGAVKIRLFDGKPDVHLSLSGEELKDDASLEEFFEDLKNHPFIHVTNIESCKKVVDDKLEYINCLLYTSDAADE